MSTKNPIPPCPFLDSEEGMEFYYSENMTCDSCSNSDEHRAFLEGWHRGWNASKVKMVEELLLRCRPTTEMTVTAGCTCLSTASGRVIRIPYSQWAERSTGYTRVMWTMTWSEPIAAEAWENGRWKVQWSEIPGPRPVFPGTGELDLVFSRAHPVRCLWCGRELQSNVIAHRNSFVASHSHDDLMIFPTCRSREGQRTLKHGTRSPSTSSTTTRGSRAKP